MDSVLFIINNLGRGGAERVILDLYTNPPAHRTRKLALIYDIIEYNANRDELIILNNLRSDRVSTLDIIIRELLFPIIIISNSLKYRRHIKKEHSSISVSFLEMSNIINVIACLFTNTKCIASLRNNPEITTGLYESVEMMLSIVLVRHFSDGIITNSEHNKDILISKYHFDPQKVKCIYNPKDIQSIRMQMLENVDNGFFRTSEPILLSVGRLYPQKGYVHLLRVFAQLRKHYSCRLAICGKGPLEIDLKNLATNLNISHSVEFLGQCENPFKYMNASDIFVMSSIYEGQPNALIEALICGCPVVSTDCDSGPREILENGKYGLLTMKLLGKVENQVTDPLSTAEQDLYDKIEMFLTNPELRKEYANKSKEIWCKFDKDKIINEYYDAFDKF